MLSLYKSPTKKARRDSQNKGGCPQALQFDRFGVRLSGDLYVVIFWTTVRVGKAKLSTGKHLNLGLAIVNSALASPSPTQSLTPPIFQLRGRAAGGVRFTCIQN